ncbi:hypothetical protein [Emticicia sp. W12TSBA100-4]|uniref:hypothetical protein n=1 Tax=Emticicia sp. W12TSBA100-4 TaxID=3160965 RepID=UPI003305944B
MGNSEKYYLTIIKQLLGTELDVRSQLLSNKLSKEDRKKLLEVLKNIEKAKESIAKEEGKSYKELMKKSGEVASWLYKIVRMMEFLA